MTRLRYIDGLRAIAVLAVLVGHTYPLTFFDGVRGVDLFFVLSGFCLSAPYLAGKRFDVGAFYRARIARIAPPYYVALGVFLALALTGFACPPDLTTDWVRLRSQLPAELSLLGIPLRPMVDLPFWTLAVEARWYLVCPLLILLYMRSRAAFLALGLALYALHAVWNVLDIGTLPCFMLGIVAADVKRHRFAGLAAVVMVTAALLWPHGSKELDHGNVLWHLAAFSMVLAAHDLPDAVWRPLQAIGAASYSIYLVHFPVLMYLQSRGITSFLAMAAALAAGLAFWWVVERRLIAWFKPRHSRPRAPSGPPPIVRYSS